jgi:hypothetical protein
MIIDDIDNDKPNTDNDESFSITDEEYERLEEERKQIINNANEKYGNGNGNSKSKLDGTSSDDKRSVAEKLVDLISQNSNSFFKDQYDVPFARIHNTDHHEIVRVGSDKFKRYLGRLYYENENKVANTEALTNAVQVLQAKAEYRGDTIPLSLRVASHNGDIFYDLTNEKWQCIRITRECWQLLDEAPTPMFMRYNQTSQLQPDSDYDYEIFDKFLQLTNLKKEEDRTLLKVYIISLFIPNIQHVILQVHGEKGGAKSMLETLIKELVDPAKPKLLSTHKDRMEFIQQLAHNYLAYYDNLKYIPGWLSDEVCRAVTGSGSSKRKLYSDDDDIVYEYRRCLGFNGINVILTEPDALDRSITIEQDRIGDENRRQEEEIVAKFLEIRPKLLAYIFDILVKTLQIKPSVELKQLPRMADFAIWGEAIARAMGYKDLEFITTYYDNIGKQNVEAIENNALGQAIARLVSSWYQPERPSIWYTSTSILLEKLNRIALDHNINTGSKTWPRAANSLTRKLKTILSNLREGLGFDISITRNTTGKHKGVSSVKIWKIPSPSSPSSPDLNQARNHDKNGEDTFDGEDTYPHQTQIPSLENGENRAQKSSSEGSEGSEDIFCIEEDSHVYSCYHNYCNFHTNDEKDYHRHAAQKHTGIPVLYPTKAELEKYGLQAQGKDWEI